MERAKRLYRLQELDQDEEKTRRRLAEVEGALGESARLRSAREAAQQAVEAVRRWTVRQQDLELQVGALKKKIADSERRLYSGNVRNPKELSDLQAEVGSLKRRLERREEELLEAMIGLEEAEEAARRAQEHLEAVEREWSAEQAALREEKERLESHLQEIAEVRNALLPSIPPGDLEAYRSLRQTKGGLAVAQVINGACVGCGMEVPSARLQAARGTDLVFCGNCERILLVVE
ncbi:MAG TPA: hypothetical protein G4O00_03500 [Thermoflexia bacterium]|jgi:hypothetical protein|nr:hypothetical protein [Thermoflexia bacterium]